ncbi:MAG: hypothetical protein LDLANPLL_00296 [Turneriella sp.]|nr:hypothetical protein [Turneriella sp.]
MGAGMAKLVYSNPALLDGSTDTILIRCSDATDGALSGQSQPITVRKKVELKSFKITAPDRAYAGDEFSITITAMGTDGQPLTNYNGSVNLSALVPNNYVTGTLTPSAATGFTSGSVTLNNVKFSVGVASLRIAATDTTDATKTGKSNLVNVFGNDFNVIAVPVDLDSDGTMDAARLTYSRPVGAQNFKIYYDDDGDGDFSASELLSTETVQTYRHNGLTVGNDYRYRVDVYDSGGNLIRQAPASITLKNCTDISGGAAAISTSTTWTKASAPYCINANVTVTGTGTRLTIEPGVTLLFNAATYGVSVSSGASIQSVGTMAEPVIFTSAKPNAAPKDWSGVLIDTNAEINNLSVTVSGNEAISETNGTTGSSFIYTVFEYSGVNGSNADGSAIRARVPIWIEYSQFRFLQRTNCSGGSAGIFVDTNVNTWVILRSNHFLENKAGNCGTTPADVFLNNGRAVLKSNSFYNSIADSNSNGGSISTASTMGASTFAGNLFFNTIDKRGGALVIKNINNIIKQNLFKGTSTNGCTIGFAACQGGAIFIDANSGANRIENNVFDSTYSNGGGAIYVGAGNGVVITGNYFKNTKGLGSHYSFAGGAISLNSGAVNTTISENIFENCFMEQNFPGISHGGAIGIDYGNNSTTIITHNSFYSSKATYANNMTGGALLLRATYDNPSSSVKVNYNHFYDSQAKTNGGAISILGTNVNNPEITHNNFINSKVNGATDNVLYSEETATYTVDNNFWGTDLSAATKCSDAGSYCSKSGGAFDVPLTNNQATAWPLCCADPGNAQCVGAALLPQGVVCQ